MDEVPNLDGLITAFTDRVPDVARAAVVSADGLLRVTAGGASVVGQVRGQGTRAASTTLASAPMVCAGEDMTSFAVSPAALARFAWRRRRGGRCAPGQVLERCLLRHRDHMSR